MSPPDTSQYNEIIWRGCAKKRLQIVVFVLHWNLQ